MKNIYTVEKFKQSFDKDGNEVLTKIDAAKNMPEIEASNSINGNCIFSNFFGITYNIQNTIDADGNINFENYNIAISTQKFESLGNYFNSSSGDWTNDATSEDITKGIVGARFAGQDNSERSGTDIVTHTMKNRFSPPLTNPREINTIFLGYLVQFSASQDNAFFSSVVLNVPCIQQNDEVLIITYRYVFDKLELAQNLYFYDNNPVAALAAAEQLGTFTAESAQSVPFGNVTNLSYASANGIESGKYLLGGTNGNTFTTFEGHSSNETDYKELAVGVSINLTVNDLVGCFLNSILGWSNKTIPSKFTNDGTYNFPVDAVTLRRPTDTVVQNQFNKSKTTADVYSSVATPFYNVNSEGGSLGDLNITDDLSSGNTSYDITTGFGELLRTEITLGGIGGNAQYKIATKMFTSFLNASGWSPQGGTFLMSGSKNYETDSNRRLLDVSYRLKEFGLIDCIAQAGVGLIKPLQLSEVVVLTRTNDSDNNGLFLHSTDINKISNDLPSILDSTTISGFLATDIRGFCTAEDGTMFVACAATGLWKLTRNKNDLVSATTANLVSSTNATTDTSCHAVNFGRYGHRFNSDAKLVAAFGDELCISTDGGTTWNMFNAGTTPAFNPAYTADSIIGIATHPDHNEVIITSRTTETPYEYVKGVSTSPLGDGVVNQWDGSSGTITTGIAHVTRHRAACQYGGANNLCMPVSNAGTYKWAMRNISTESTGGLFGFNSVNTLVSVQAFISYCASFEFIYDDSVDDTIIMSTLGKITASYWENIINNVNDDSEVLALSVTRDSAFFALGRNVFLGTGYINSNTFFTKTSVNNTRDAFFGLFTPFHFSWGNVPSRDFYENNPLNVWYPYGWDGANWILDGTASKVSLTTVDPLVKGISAQFINDVSASTDPLNFIADEVFDTYLFDGIIKDDYTTVSFDSYYYPSINQLGNEFFPSTVPSAGAGQVTQTTIGLETYKHIVTGANTAILYYEKGKVSQIALSNGGLFTNDDSSMASISPEIPDADFTYEFKLGLTITGDLMDTTTTDVYSHPSIILADVAQTIPSGYATMSYGIRPTINPANPSGLRLYVWEALVLVATLDFANYSPKTDVFAFVRDDTAGTFEVRLNGTQIHTFVNSPIGKSYKSFFLSYGFNYNTEIANNIAGIGTQIFDMKLSFNDQRRLCKIGNGSTTGAWAENFGSLLSLELEKGVKKIFLDGVEASLVYDYSTNLPLAGEVKINVGTGELVFNPADAGKDITGEWRYLPSVNK